MTAEVVCTFLETTCARAGLELRTLDGRARKIYTALGAAHELLA